MSRAEVAEALMTGKVSGVTEQDVAKLYPKMPGVAKQVWLNVRELQLKQANARKKLS